MFPLIILGIVEFIRGALVFSLIPMYGQFVVGHDLSVIGTAISVHYLMDNIFRLPAGWLTDRHGGKIVMAGGLVLSAVGIYLLFSSPNVTFYILGAALFGLGIAPVWPAVISGVAARIPTHQLGEALSKVFIAWLLGAGLGPVVINFIIGYSYKISFMFLLGTLLIAILMAAFGRMPHLETPNQLPLTKYLKELVQEIKSLTILYPGMFIQTTSIGILMPVIAIYARTVYGFTTTQFNYLIIGAGVFTVLLLIPAGKLADRWGVKWPLIGGFIVAAISLFLLPLQKTLATTLVFGIFLGISYAFILPAWNGLQARVVSEEKRGTMWAFFMTVEGVGTATGAYIGGKVWVQFGHQAPFFASALILFLVAIFYSFSNIEKLIKKVVGE